MGLDLGSGLVRHHFHRREKQFRFAETPALAFEKLRHGIVMENQQGILKDLRGEVQVSGLPCHERSVRGALEGDAIDDFRELADDVVETIPMQDHATIEQAAVEIESQLDTIRRGGPPAALEENPAFDLEDHLAVRRKRGRFREQALDEMHWMGVNGIRAMISAT